MTAASAAVLRPLAISAPVSVDVANMTLIVRRPENSGGGEKLVWRDSHAALVRDGESYSYFSTPVWGSAPGNHQSPLRNLGRI
jgi:hypothetical protein